MTDTLLLILATYYIVEVMMIKPMSLGKGLFESNRKIILYPQDAGGEIFWYENFFDRIRGAIMPRLYVEDSDDRRILNEKRAAVFMCPICLSFWVALIICFFRYIPFESYEFFLFSVPACAGGSTFLHLYLMKADSYDTD